MAKTGTVGMSLVKVNWNVKNSWAHKIMKWTQGTPITFSIPVPYRSAERNGGIRTYYEFQFQFEFRRTKGDPNVKRTEASISSFPVLGTNVILLSEQNLRSTSFSLQPSAAA